MQIIKIKLRRISPFSHFADTDKNMFLSIAAIKNNEEIFLASDMVRDEISSCVDDQPEGCPWITDSKA